MVLITYKSAIDVYDIVLHSLKYIHNIGVIFKNSLFSFISMFLITNESATDVYDNVFLFSLTNRRSFQ